MINNDLDLPALARALAVSGRLQIADYLQQDAALLLHDVLDRQVPWTLAWHDAESDRSQTVPREQWSACSAGERAARVAALTAQARGRYGFAYESYMMVKAYLDRIDPELPLHSVVEFLNSPDYLAFARILTGDTSIRRANAQATCYRSGHFLKKHSDIDSREGRRYAYVINLTRRWEADWGGLLQFLDAQGRVVESFSPQWNSLSIFKVPTDHCVSLVAPWAEMPRYAITGWFMS